MRYSDAQTEATARYNKKPMIGSMSSLKKGSSRSSRILPPARAKA